MLARCAFVVCLSASFVFAGENWPQFRGPGGLGRTDEKALPKSWNIKDGTNVLWSAPLHGEGHSSPVVRSGKVFATGVEWEPGAKRESVIPTHHVTCYNAADGKELWNTQVPPGPWKRADFRSGPGGGYASSTPAVDDKHVYVVFSSAVIAALDFEGKIVWRKEIIPYGFDVTIGASPILFGSNVLLLCDMADKKNSRLIASDAATGETKWVQARAGAEFSHGTPVLIDVDGKPQLVVNGHNAVEGLDPTDGKSLWRVKVSYAAAASPGYGEGIIYCDSGRGGVGQAIDPRGSGDVSTTHVKWKVPQVPEGLGSPVIVGDYVYRAHTPGIIKCWKRDTGELVYAERVQGLSTRASPFVDGEGNIYFASAAESFVIRGGPKFELLGKGSLGDNGEPSAAPAAGRIFLKGTKKLFCVGNK